MRQSLRQRFWPEASLGAVSAVLAIVTALWPSWIETITGLDPDHGSGSAEVLIVFACGIGALLLAILARGEWLRASGEASKA